MKSELGDKQRLQHMLDAIGEVESYVSTSSFEDFLSNSMMRFASIKQLEIVGEAANMLSKGLKEKFTNIEWSQVVAARNIFVHEYFGIDIDLVWQILVKDLPALKSKIEAVIKEI